MSQEISYDLAKELKDAGFPHKAPYISEMRMPNGKNLPAMPDWEGAVHVPTLSELIEACGDSFSALGRVFNEKDDFKTPEKGERWNAHSHGWLIRPPFAVGGSTPEEAVARLWLALSYLSITDGAGKLLRDTV